MCVRIEQGKIKPNKKNSSASFLSFRAQPILTRFFPAVIILGLLFVFMNQNLALAAEALGGISNETPNQTSNGISEKFSDAVHWEEKELPIGEEINFSLILIDGDELYVMSGDSHNFLQGYQLYVKGADPEASKIWIELCRDGVSLQDDIATKGTQFVYSRNSSEILNLTVDTIYSGSDGVLVRFYPVYQYLDPTPSRAQVPEETNSNNSVNLSSGFLESEKQGEGFGICFFFLSLGLAFIIMGFFSVFRKKNI